MNLTQISRRINNKIMMLFCDEARLESLVGPAGGWKLTERFPLEFLRSQSLEEHDSVLEIGCGVLRVGTHLISYLDANGYVGIDIRPEVIDISHKQIAKHRLGNKNPIVITSDSFGQDDLENKEFDYVLAFQVLYHLEDEIAERCFEEVSKRLKSDGQFFANVNVEAQPASWREFPLVQRSLDFYRNMGEQYGLTMKVIGQLKDFGFTDKLGGHRNHMLLFVKHQTRV